MAGCMKGKKGIVEKVNLKEAKVYIDTVKIKKTDGSEVLRALRPSNLMITSLNLEDKSRQRVLERAKKAKEALRKKEEKSKQKEVKPTSRESKVG